MFPMDEKLLAENWKVFKHTPLCRTGSVSDLQICSADEVQVIEDSNESAPPSWTGENYKPPKAARVFQLGEIAAQKFLSSAIQDIGGQEAAKPVVLVIDLTTHTGDITKAFCNELFSDKGKAAHLYYCGFCESDLEARGPSHNGY